ncbi:MAG: nucleoside deaminase [Acidimicrobiaceae bacterium]|nr:nucleoside deaminase [Acidimicrobiaceae bacterium]
MQDPYALWSSLARPWQQAFEAAWASWRSGSLGVGAAITDAQGTIVAVGQNRRFDPPDGPGPLAGIPMAHAEMNALASLPAAECRGYTLYTTLEPCFMCAATMTGTYHIPRVLFASHDPSWDGLEEVFRRQPVTARFLPQREHLGGPYSVLAYVLHLAAILHHWPGPRDDHERLAPGRLALARQVLQRGDLGRLARDGAGPQDVAHALWADLCRVAAIAA